MIEEDHCFEVMAGVSANSSDKCDIECVEKTYFTVNRHLTFCRELVINSYVSYVGINSRILTGYQKIGAIHHLSSQDQKLL